MKIGGEARFFVRAETEDDILAALDFAREKELPVFILGGGSNVLIADEGFDGLVLQIGLQGIEENEGIVTAGGGEDWDAFVNFCVEKNLAGLECLSGIPGFVGAAPIQNIGAYGQEVSETISAVRVLDLTTKQIVELSNADCEFAYRSSIFNSTQKGRYIVLAVTFVLQKEGAPALRYADLKKYFGDAEPTLMETREAVIAIRSQKSMVISATDPNSRSAGSFFKNPIVDVTQFENVQRVAAEMGIDNVPSYPAAESKVKIPAAWLIEKSGYSKGFELGRAGLSENHTLALVNRSGDARAADIVALKELIQEKVFASFAIDLHPEPIFVGFRD